MALVTSSSAAHWYYPDGRPCHTVPMTTKGREHEQRNTTVRDARLLNLKPSVTTVNSLLAKEFLTNWKVEQSIIAALTLPRLENETVDAFAQRIVLDAEAQVEKAKKIGTLLHDSIEKFITNGTPCDDPLIKPLIGPFIEWWETECVELIYAEQTVVAPSYAGRVDCKVRLKSYGLVIADFKGRKKGTNGKFATYRDDCLQLAAYRDADALTRPRADSCISVLMNNVPSEPASLHVHQWDEDSLDMHLKAFQSNLKTWTLLNRYDPSETKEETIKEQQLC